MGSPDFETAIIGAGVVGLAIARALSRAGHDTLVLEQHGLIGSETSSRNSEVIHAGIYYPPGSLKALSCVKGKHLLYDFCRSHGVPHRQTGKIIIATCDEQKAALISIKETAIRNGVDDLTALDAADLRRIEPELRGVAGLFSPSTGIIDSHAYMLALQGDAEAEGCQFAFHTKADTWSKAGNGCFELKCAETKLTAKNLVVCGGLHSARFAGNTKEPMRGNIPKVHYAKGNYFRLSSAAPFSHLVYPVPEPGGLGVHLTLDMGGLARFGPDVEWIERTDYAVDPARSAKFYGAIRKYWPGLPDNALQPDYAGIRPKLSGQGEPNADFVIWEGASHDLPGFIALYGVESPGLTASLALAEMVSSMITRG